MPSPTSPTSAERGGNARACESVAVAAYAYAASKRDGGGFVRAVVRLPIVRQSPMPDCERFDHWARIDGPLSDL
jgi:hypothetical protein